MDNKFSYFSPSNRLYMVVIALLIVIPFVDGHYIIGLAALLFYAVLVIYNIKKLKIKRNEWNKFIQEFSFNLDNAARSTLMKLPFPLIIVGTKGEVLWYNRNTSIMLENEDILGTNIIEIIKDFDLEQVMADRKALFQGIKFKSKAYDIHVSVVETEDDKANRENIALLYFYEVTKVLELEKKIYDNKDCIELIEVDNLDDVVKSTEENSKPLLIAEVERTINNYAQSLNAMIKKYSNNKYIMVVQNKYVLNQIEKKFDILNSIKEISSGNKFPVTLSIGIGIGGENPLQNYALANSAEELALGRGGDQVVIKDGEKLSFFGGGSREMEKVSRVKSRVISHALLNLINESNQIFIMGHKNPDIDCLGAAVGIFRAIKYLGKDSYIVMEDINSSLNPMFEKIKTLEDYDNAFIDSIASCNTIDEDSLLILVDVHNKSYVCNMDLVKLAKRIVIIDHHRKASDFIDGALLSFIEPYASSTCELVTEMLQYMVENPKLNPIEAEALLAGICIDTKDFYFKTGVRTFEAAAFLKKFGADTVAIKRMFSDNFNTYIDRSEIIKSAEIEDGIAIAICPANIQDVVLVAQAADELLNITGIQASFVFVKIGDEIVISGRSFGEVNVQRILESLGGGGHMTIAGARLENMSMEEAVAKLKETLEKLEK